MGRKLGQLKVEFIENKKSRFLTFKRRKECLMKKAKELSTLCDVNACLIVHAPEHALSVWPPNDPALVDRLIRAKNPNSKNDDIDESQFLFRLGKKAQQVNAEIDRLMSDQQHQFASTAAMPSQDHQFGPNLPDNSSDASTAMMMMPQGPLMVDDGLMAGDEFGPTFHLLDNSSTAMMMKMPHGSGEQAQFVIDDQYHHHHQDHQFGDLGIDDQDHQFGHLDDQFHHQEPVDLDHSQSPMWLEEEAEDLLMVHQLVNDDTEFSMGYSSSYQHPQQQQQYEMWPEEDSLVNLGLQEEDSLMNPGFHHEQTSRETAVAADDDVALQDTHYHFDDDFAALLYTPPMMTWQPTDDDDLMFTQNGATDFFEGIDDLWA